MDKIITELKQFKCYNYDEWLALSNYIPSQGEICGVIIQQDSDINTNFNIPDGYEILDPPYTLLKMGNGINNIAELPWISSTESEVIQNIVSKIFNGELEGTGTELLQQYINDLLDSSRPDWDVIDPTNLSYINNKICGPIYEILSNPQTHLNKISFYGEKLEENPEYYILEYTQNFNPNFSLTEFDLYDLHINHHVYTKQIKHIDLNTEDIKEIWGFGNFNLFTQILGVNSIDLSIEATSDLFWFGAYIVDNEIRYILILHKNEVFNEGLGSHAIISLIKKAKNKGFKQINPKFLPSSATEQPNWLINDPSQGGYIKNKICNILSYTSDNTQFYNDIINIGKDPKDITTTIQIANLFNFWDRYTVTIGDRIYEDLPCQQIYLENLLNFLTFIGNPFLFFNELDKLFASSGQPTPKYITNLLELYPDNGAQIVLILPNGKGENQIQIYRPNENLIPINFYEWTNNNKPIIKLISPSELNISTSEDLSKFNNGYIVAQDITYKIISVNKIDNGSWNIQTNLNIEDLDSKPITGIYDSNYYNKLKIIRVRKPDKVSLIDPMWISDEIKIGRYNNNQSLNDKAEIFNDYINNIANGQYSHAEGYNTIAIGQYQHVQGKYNKNDQDKAFIIGNGTSNTNRSNAYSLDWQGNSLQAGKATAQDFISHDNKHTLSQKENSINKVNTIAKSSEIEFPTTQAVINYIQNLLNITPDNNGNITLEFTSIDGNGIY